MHAGGVLDAGVILAYLDSRDSRYPTASSLISRAGREEVALVISTVNLAEVLALYAPVATKTGIDAVAVLQAANIQLIAPEISITRRAAVLAGTGSLSLADRFALATAQELRARLYTTDGELAKASGQIKIPVSRL